MFETIVKRERNSFISFAQSISFGKDKAAAEDCVQDFLFRSYKALHQFNQRGESAEIDMLKWLRTNLPRQIYNYHRHETCGARMPPGGKCSLNEAWGVKFEQHYQDGLWDDNLRAVFKKLCPEFQAVILLREIGGLTYDEISYELNIPRGTVMSRLHRARKYLRKRLKNNLHFK